MVVRKHIDDLKIHKLRFNIGLIVSTLLGCDSFAASRAEPVVEALQIQVLEDKISRSIHYVLQQIDDQVTRS